MILLLLWLLGCSVALVVNNLGGTSNLELLVVLNEAIRYLGKEEPGRHMRSTLCYLLCYSGPAETKCGSCGVWQFDDFSGNGRSLPHSSKVRARMGEVYR